MQQVRQSVFETNSSSSHSLTLSQDNLVDLPLSALTLRRGTLSLQLSDYGWEWHRYYTPEEKANYLLTAAWGGGCAPDGSEESAVQAMREENPRVDMLCRVIEEHTGVKVLVVPGCSGYVDHQSVGVGLPLFESEDLLKQFLFSKDAFIQTGNDNSDPGRFIDTDRGHEETFAPWYREPLAKHVKVVLQKDSEWSSDIKLAGGQILQESAPDLWEQLRTRASVVQVKMTSSGRNNAFQFREGAQVDSAMSKLAGNGLYFSQNLDIRTRHVDDDNAKQYYQVLVELVVAVPQDLADALFAVGAAQPLEANAS